MWDSSPRAAGECLTAWGQVEMSLKFALVNSSAVDLLGGVRVPGPRLLLTTLPDGRDGIEFQFSIYRADVRIGGTGFNVGRKIPA